MLRDAWGLGPDEPPPPAPPQVIAMKDEVDEMRMKLNAVGDLKTKISSLESQMSEMKDLMKLQLELLQQRN